MNTILKTDIIFMNSDDSIASEPYVLIFKLTDKIRLKKR